MRLSNIHTLEINKSIIKKGTLFKKKTRDNEVHLVEVDQNGNFIIGGKYIVFNFKQYNSPLFKNSFKKVA